MFPKKTAYYSNKDLKILVIKEFLVNATGIASFFQPYNNKLAVRETELSVLKFLNNWGL